MIRRLADMTQKCVLVPVSFADRPFRPGAGFPAAGLTSFVEAVRFPLLPLLAPRRYFVGSWQRSPCGVRYLSPHCFAVPRFPVVCQNSCAVLGSICGRCGPWPAPMYPRGFLFHGIPPFLALLSDSFGTYIPPDPPRWCGGNGSIPYWFAAQSNSARKGANNSSSARFRAFTASSNRL